MPDTDPQAELLDRLTPEQVLDLLGPSWAEMSHRAIPGDRVADLSRQCDVGNLKRDLYEVLTRLEKRFAKMGGMNG